MHLLIFFQKNNGLLKEDCFKKLHDYMKLYKED